MRRIDECLVELGKERIYYPGEAFNDARDLGTLNHLLNEDYKDMHTRAKVHTEHIAEHIIKSPKAYSPLSAGR